MFNEGYSLEHVLQIRQLEEAIVVDHVLRSANEGFPVKAHWLLDRDRIEILERFVADNVGERLPKLLAALPNELQSNDLLFFLQCRASHGETQLSSR